MESNDPEFARTIANRLLYLMHRGQVASTDLISTALEDLGVNGRIGLVLEILLATPGISAARLARACRVTRQALLLPIQQLEERGLLVRPDADPAVRVRPLELTSDGRKLAGVVAERTAALEARALDAFDDDERTTFRALLERYVEAWESQRADAEER